MTFIYRIKKLALELLRKSKVANLSPVTNGLTLGLYNYCLIYIRYPINGIEGAPASSIRFLKVIVWRCRQLLQKL